MQSELDSALEALMDKHGPQAMADALARVCYAKADNVRSNWQDEPLAKTWEKNAQAFDKCSYKVTA